MFITQDILRENIQIQLYYIKGHNFIHYNRLLEVTLHSSKEEFVKSFQLGLDNFLPFCVTQSISSGAQYGTLQIKIG
jgi:hypothetical protein